MTGSQITKKVKVQLVKAVPTLSGFPIFKLLNEKEAHKFHILLKSPEVYQ